MKKFVLLIVLLSYSLTLNAQLTQQQVDDFYKKFKLENQSEFDKMFSKSFLAKVPVDKIAGILTDFSAKYGKFEKAILKSGNTLEILYEKAKMPGTLTFDNEGKVVGLWYGMPTLISDSLSAIKEELLKLKGDVSICIKKDSDVIFEINKSKPLAIGSTFKLYVLKALKYQFDSGKIKYEDVVNLKEKSLPSGILQNWPEDTPITIATLANLMISISDNTATDALIRKLGRDYIEKYAPETMKPFYMTSELFRLKLGLKDEEIKSFIAMDVPVKREYLKTLNKIKISDLDASKFSKPIFIDLEWYSTTEELCNVMMFLKFSPHLAINPGLADKDDWNYVGFKGGSEPGVLNYTHILVKDKDKTPFTISATINDHDKNVDEGHEFTLLVTRLIQYLKKQ